MKSFKLIFWGFIISPFFVVLCFAQVEVTFDPSTSPDVKSHEIYWGRHFGSRAFYVSVFGSPYTIKAKWLEKDIEYFLFVVARDSAFNVSEKSHANFAYNGVSTNVNLPEMKIEKLAMTYPNPFNAILNIREGLEVKIYDLLGNKIGVFSGQWDASNHSSGFYFIVGKSNVERVVLLK